VNTNVQHTRWIGTALLPAFRGQEPRQIGPRQMPDFLFVIFELLQSSQNKNIVYDPQSLRNGKDGWITGSAHSRCSLKGNEASDLSDAAGLAPAQEYYTAGSIDERNSDDLREEELIQYFFSASLQTARFQQVMEEECETNDVLRVIFRGRLPSALGATEKNEKQLSPTISHRGGRGPQDYSSSICAGSIQAGTGSGFPGALAGRFQDRL